MSERAVEREWESTAGAEVDEKFGTMTVIWNLFTNTKSSLESILLKREAEI